MSCAGPRHVTHARCVGTAIEVTSAGGGGLAVYIDDGTAVALVIVPPRILSTLHNVVATDAVYSQVKEQDTGIVKGAQLDVLGAVEHGDSGASILASSCHIISEDDPSCQAVWWLECAKIYRSCYSCDKWPGSDHSVTTATNGVARAALPPPPKDGWAQPMEDEIQWGEEHMNTATFLPAPAPPTVLDSPSPSGMVDNLSAQVFEIISFGGGLGMPVIDVAKQITARWSARRITPPTAANVSSALEDLQLDGSIYETGGKYFAL